MQLLNTTVAYTCAFPKKINNTQSYSIVVCCCIPFPQEPCDASKHKVCVDGRVHSAPFQALAHQYALADCLGQDTRQHRSGQLVTKEERKLHHCSHPAKRTSHQAPKEVGRRDMYRHVCLQQTHEGANANLVWRSQMSNARCQTSKHKPEGQGKKTKASLAG